LYTTGHFLQVDGKKKKEAQLSQRDRAMLSVIEYFAKCHSMSFELTPFSQACGSLY